MHLPRAEPALRLLHHVAPARSPLPASPCSPLLRGSALPCLPLTPRPPQLLAPTHVALSLQPTLPLKLFAKVCTLFPGLKPALVACAQGCGPDRVQPEVGPVPLGVSLLCLLGPGWARHGTQEGWAWLCVCVCMRMPHTSVQSQPASCVWAKGGRVLCTGHWRWGQLHGGHLSLSGSWYPPDPLRLYGNGL